MLGQNAVFGVLLRRLSVPVVWGLVLSVFDCTWNSQAFPCENRCFLVYFVMQVLGI